jgi:hypothetical protein
LRTTTDHMNGILGAFLPLFVLLQVYGIVSAYPALIVVPSSGPESDGKSLATIRSVPSKRAFDRLDMSPFDFGSLSKRYFDEEDMDRRKKAFDRLDTGAFGLSLKKRTFDRIDSGFTFGKRSAALRPLTLEASSRAKRPFDRLDSGNFGLMKRSNVIRIADLAQESDLTPYFYAIP